MDDQPLTLRRGDGVVQLVVTSIRTRVVRLDFALASGGNASCVAQPVEPTAQQAVASRVDEVQQQQQRPPGVDAILDVIDDLPDFRQGNNDSSSGGGRQQDVYSSPGAGYVLGPLRARCANRSVGGELRSTLLEMLAPCWAKLGACLAPVCCVLCCACAVLCLCLCCAELRRPVQPTSPLC
jgi:hypothetical protein